MWRSKIIPPLALRFLSILIKIDEYMKGDQNVTLELSSLPLINGLEIANTIEFNDGNWT